MDVRKTGAFICALRKEKGLTQAQLAEKLNISNRTVSKWENADGMPDVALLQDLAKALDVSVDELLNGEKSELAEIKVTEIESKSNIDNMFQICFVTAIFCAAFAAILGCVTEIYNCWAFDILFYNHWEILFVAIAFCAEVASGLIYCVGITRLTVAYKKQEIIEKISQRTYWLAVVLSMLPVAFLVRVFDCSRYGNYTMLFFLFLLAIVLSIFIIIRKNVIHT